MPALVIGSALAGAVQVLDPARRADRDRVQPGAVDLRDDPLGLTVAICSNVDAFFALSFASTFTPGSIVAFLLVGPLVDVKMLALHAHDLHDAHARGASSPSSSLSAFAIAVGVNLLA